jgi:hypothetical protein
MIAELGEIVGSVFFMIILGFVIYKIKIKRRVEK